MIRQKTFQQLRAQFAQAPVLRLYNPDLPLKLARDASSYGVEAVLSQIYPDKSEHHFAYASRALNQHEKMYPQVDKGVSIIFGLKKFHQFLYGRHFVLSTSFKTHI